MAEQIGLIKITGCYQNICFYQLYEKFYARSKSSLSGKRVKNDPAFRKTMEYASWMASASKTGSDIYRRFYKGKKDRKIYQAITGKALHMLKEGFSIKEIYDYLSKEIESFQGLKF